MNTQNLALGLVVVLAFVGSYMGAKRPVAVQTVVEKTFGAAAGPFHTEFQEFAGGFKKGGSTYATSSTAATYTLTSTEVREDRSYISWNANINTTLTTMASTSYPLSALKAGEEFSLNFYNASTTAAATITFAAGTGVDLQEDTGEVVIVNGLEMARLTFLKKADTDVILWVEGAQLGD